MLGGSCYGLRRPGQATPGVPGVGLKEVLGSPVYRYRRSKTQLTCALWTPADTDGPQRSTAVAGGHFECCSSSVHRGPGGPVVARATGYSFDTTAARVVLSGTDWAHYAALKSAALP